MADNLISEHFIIKLSLMYFCQVLMQEFRLYFCAARTRLLKKGIDIFHKALLIFLFAHCITTAHHQVLGYIKFMQALIPSVTLKVCTKRVVRERKHLGVSQLSMFL